MTAQTGVYSSNSVRLSWREWAVAASALLAVLWLLPAAWPARGRELSRPDYRLPVELSDDYWMFRQWAEHSGKHYLAVALGDSVIWGQYARSDDTLTHHLNSLLGERAFGNLGVDGLHPAAMAGLLGHYGGGIRDEAVLVHLNPLWLGSGEQDLQGGQARFNHPELVPQVFHRPAAYRPTLSEAVAAVLPRELPPLSWKEHLQIAYYEGMGLPEWTLDNPYAFIPANRGPDAFGWQEPASQPMTWRERGIVRQDLPWVEPARSYQWQSFQKAIELLRARGNRVFVLVGPFNTHSLAGQSAARYERLVGEMTRWLANEHIPYCAPPTLPTDLYADASHPLGAGYREVAEELLASSSFQEWMQSWAPGRLVRRPRSEE